ncbi:hypothetical protein [Clostridium culturomicium]|uniref:hypothetical protein n=1 Tax=Clostridium culturomicium TaxID=1499683 RepID=UPI0038579FED
MGFFKNKDKSINCLVVDGLPNYPKNTILQLNLNNESECLVISSKMYKNHPDVNLRYEQIVAANVITEQEIVQQSKSVIGRAAVGGVVLGSLGAIIGGLSGTGTKTNNQTEYYIVINYKSRELELKILSFKITGFSNWKAFIKELQSKINTNQSFEKEIYL